ncbi:uncharacterized protein ASPGLDRAFT_1125488 [Aspergillus glaucus CBS 516.65]|uniref:Uncharacterized protein n=1 Tax=Aspergillus glaucus CBS 516.65 TaxID=1160497 RepID=A0A1L9VT47_ASPGL|nr:hypothetical protein ASPGLDRAFT_1125488 [Aspergillus glaucus CBS 516.65]OJJ87093.1 hypothetical protein ASPGLDRAFT_1125488 [Aspergillus glaucus CBS 516.65]
MTVVDICISYTSYIEVKVCYKKGRVRPTVTTKKFLSRSASSLSSPGLAGLLDSFSNLLSSLRFSLRVFSSSSRVLFSLIVIVLSSFRRSLVYFPRAASPSGVIPGSHRPLPSLPSLIVINRFSPHPPSQSDYSASDSTRSSRDSAINDSPRYVSYIPVRVSPR